MPDFDLDDGDEAARLHKAAKRAEASLRVARHANTGEAERDAAIAGALRIIEANGLNPDSFDIPGRARPKVKPPPASRYRDDLYTRPRSPFYSGNWTRADLDDVMARFREEMRRGARSDSAAAWNAGRAHGGDPNRSGPAMDKLRADLCVAFLWNRTPPVRVYGNAPGVDGSRRWIIPAEAELEYTDAGVIEVAERHGWGREEEPPGGMSGRKADRATVDDLEAGPDRVNVGEAYTPDYMARVVRFLIGNGVDVQTFVVRGRGLQWLCGGEMRDDREVVLLARLMGFEE